MSYESDSQKYNSNTSPQDGLLYECTTCGEEYRTYEFIPCPDCGDVRRRYAGPLDGGRSG